jgi:hypothetical protein
MLPAKKLASSGLPEPITLDESSLKPLECSKGDSGMSVDDSGFSERQDPD